MAGSSPPRGPCVYCIHHAARLCIAIRNTDKKDKGIFPRVLRNVGRVAPQEDFVDHPGYPDKALSRAWSLSETLGGARGDRGPRSLALKASIYTARVRDARMADNGHYAFSQLGPPSLLCIAIQKGSTFAELNFTLRRRQYVLAMVAGGGPPEAAGCTASNRQHGSA
jgi:hypothetical protein